VQKTRVKNQLSLDQTRRVAADLNLEGRINTKRKEIAGQSRYIRKLEGGCESEDLPAVFRRDIAANSYLPLAKRRLEELKTQLEILS
jgi:hypothetical protein